MSDEARKIVAKRNRRRGATKSPWIRHVKAYAAKNKISYACAISEASKSYKERATPKNALFDRKDITEQRKKVKDALKVCAQLEYAMEASEEESQYRIYIYRDSKCHDKVYKDWKPIEGESRLRYEPQIAWVNVSQSFVPTKKQIAEYFDIPAGKLKKRTTTQRRR